MFRFMKRRRCITHQIKRLSPAPGNAEKNPDVPYIKIYYINILYKVLHVYYPVYNCTVLHDTSG